MERKHDDIPGRPPVRRGYSGEGERPWLAVWLVLLERAMRSEAALASRKEAWKASLGAFLLEFRRHPGRLTPWDIRDYLFRHGELGTVDTPRSLTTSMDAIAFFYRAVVPRPALADAALHPFDHVLAVFPPEPGAPDPRPGDDSPLLKLLREKLVENGASAYCSSTGGDWRPA